jgi:hypothetical protein
MGLILWGSWVGRGSRKGRGVKWDEGALFERRNRAAKWGSDDMEGSGGRAR